MKARRGQVALYLIAVLIALCVLVVMNVSIYLSVTAKNRATNAGDAASIAVAKYQGELLNRIGQMNLEHLRAALDDDEEGCEKLMTRQIRACFLGPIDGEAGGDLSNPFGGFSAGDKAAKENGAAIYVGDDDGSNHLDSVEWFRRHAHEIRTQYANNPELYPEPWEGAWEEYARAIERAVGNAEDCLYAVPDNINFVDASEGHVLLDQQFYNAVAGRCWCWFKFNAPGLLDTYASVQDWGPLPYADFDTRLRRCVNSEIYSLNLRVRVGSAVDLLGTDLICRLADATESDIANSYMITNKLQEWVFYDANDTWRDWYEINPSGEWHFPVVGSVRTEYNVRGCAALCRVMCGGRDVINDRDTVFYWTGGAKPFGTVLNEEGDLCVVTENKNFVTPAFSEAHLVPIDAVGGRDLHTADPDWMYHVREHLPIYLQGGVSSVRSKDCWYCQQLVIWEHASFRRTGSRWLKYHSGECVRPTMGGGTWQGGTPHGH